MRRFASLAVALVLCGGVGQPASAATQKLGGPCKKAHQVSWIKGVRVQCTWVRTSKGSRTVWKALAPAKTKATAAELGIVAPSPAPTPTLTPSATPAESVSPSATPTP